jgi:putative peptidoglycan lipid II flippase
MSNTQKMFRAAGFLIIASLVTRVLGLVRNSVMTWKFGRTSITDAYEIAFIIPDFLFWVLAGGMISASLIPVLSDYLGDSKKEERWRIVSSVTTITIGLMIVITIIFMIFTPFFINFLTPLPAPVEPEALHEAFAILDQQAQNGEIDPSHLPLLKDDIAKEHHAQNIIAIEKKMETRDLAIPLTRLLLIQPLFMALCGIAMGVLNTKNIFWPSALGALLYNAAIVVFALALSSFIGIYSFVVGVLAGSILNFAVQLPHLRKLGYHYQFLADWRHPAVRRIGFLTLPILVYQAINQFLVFAYTKAASSLGTEGDISAVFYAIRLQLLVVGVFAVQISIASFPSLSEHAAHGQKKKFIETFSQAIRVVTFISIPASVGMILLRTPIIASLFQQGAFSAADTNAVAIPLIFFAVGITAHGLNAILPRAFYAFEDTWRPVLIAIFSIVVSIGLIMLLVELFPAPYKTGGLALAMSLGTMLQSAVLFLLLRRKIGALDGRNILSSAALTTLATAVMAAGIYVWQYFIRLALPAAQDSVMMVKVTSITELAGGMCIGLFIFIAMARLFRMEEYRLVMQMVRRKKN